MAISYIKGADGTTSVTAAEKIKVYYLNQLKTNPWLSHRAVPVKSEALATGGGIYKFRSLLGIDLATRRTSAPTSSTVAYDGVISNSEVTLTVSQPFETLAFPMEQGDITQLDGINYSPIIADQITESLIGAEILNETSAVTGDANILSIDGSTATTGIEKLKLIKSKIANYYAVNEDTADWAGATSAIKGFDYFVGKNGSFTPDQIRVHMHPADFMEASNAVTELGAGSDAQYREFVEGQIPMIGGVRVIINKYIKPGETFIVPVSMIGTPDVEVMSTRIVNHKDELNFVEVMKGQHYFDSKLIMPELVTKISFNATAPAMRVSTEG